MSYMLLIVEPVGQRATRTEAEGREAYAAMVRFGEAIAAQGQLKAVESLASQDTAVRVSLAAGRAQALDGPPGVDLPPPVVQGGAVGFAHPAVGGDAGPPPQKAAIRASSSRVNMRALLTCPWASRSLHRTGT